MLVRPSGSTRMCVPPCRHTSTSWRTAGDGPVVEDHERRLDAVNRHRAELDVAAAGQQHGVEEGCRPRAELEVALLDQQRVAGALEDQVAALGGLRTEECHEAKKVSASVQTS